MQRSKPFSMRLPLDIHDWIEQSYYKRGCNSKTDYVLQLITKGLQAEAVDDTVARIHEANQAAPALEMLKRTLAIQYMVEAQAKGVTVRPERFSTDALVWAEKEMNRLYPRRSEL